jgi:peptide/nickel transport system ATP-binding protein
MTFSMAALSIENLCVSYGSGQAQNPVVKNVSLSLPKGKTMALVGESGSGKSTIAQAIIGLLPHNAHISSGKILVFDGGGQRDMAALDRNSTVMRRMRGGRVGMVFQEPSAALTPVYTVGDVLIETVRAHEPLNHAEARERSIEMLAQTGFDRPAAAMDKYPFELSGGLRQRAMIAAALICKPALLIADEPTSALDVTVQALLLKSIQDLQSGLGMSVLLITHDLGVVATIADEMTVLFRGEVMEQGPSRELLKRPEHPYLKALMAAGPSLAGEATERLTPLRATSHASVELRSRWSRPEQSRPGEVLLRVTDMSKRFTGRAAKSGQTLAVNGVGFTVRRGECLGLVGESGCGKSTLCKMIMGAIDADEGQIEFAVDGRLQMLQEIPKKDLRQRLQYVFQDPFGSLNPRRTVEQTLMEPFEIHGIGDSAQRRRWSAELLSIVGLKPDMLSRFPNAFSGGQRQRIAIARSLALKPDLLVCDEPVSALDVSVQAQVLNLLKDLKDSLGMTLLFVSHNLAVVRHLADRVAVMCQGRIVEMAPRQALFTDPQHPYTRALIAAAPDSDPDRNLDLGALMDGRASDPEMWDEPFRLLGEVKPRYKTVSEDHVVAVS